MQDGAAVNSCDTCELMQDGAAVNSCDTCQLMQDGAAVNSDFSTKCIQLYLGFVTGPVYRNIPRRPGSKFSRGIHAFLNSMISVVQTALQNSV